MSLINDALKRTRQSRQQNPSDARQPAPLQPVDCKTRPDRLFRWMIAMLIVASLASSAWFFGKWWHNGDESLATGEAGYVSASQSGTVIERDAQTPIIKVSTDIVVLTQFVAQSTSETPDPLAPTNPVISPPPTSVTTASNATRTEVEPVGPPSPFADLKLQSIIYRADKPAAVISGEMVFVGDTVRSATVLKIGRHTVVLTRGGETNELALPRL